MVITDGPPDDPISTEKVIIDAANALVLGDELSITLVQVGDDKKATEYIDEIEKHLMEQGNKFHIVDSISYKTLAKSDLQSLLKTLV